LLLVIGRNQASKRPHEIPHQYVAYAELAQARESAFAISVQQNLTRNIDVACVIAKVIDNCWPCSVILNEMAE
jgi:hypothetical protein